MNKENTYTYVINTVLNIIEKMVDDNNEVNLSRLPCPEYAYLELNELKVLITSTIEKGQLNKALDMLNLLAQQTLGKSLSEINEVINEQQ